MHPHHRSVCPHRRRCRRPQSAGQKSAARKRWKASCATSILRQSENLREQRRRPRHRARGLRTGKCWHYSPSRIVGRAGGKRGCLTSGAWTTSTRWVATTPLSPHHPPLPLPEGFVGFVPRPRHAERQGSPCRDAGPEEQELVDSQEAQSSEGHATQDEGPPHGRCRPTKRGFWRSRTPSFTVGQLLATHLISWGLA